MSARARVAVSTAFALLAAAAAGWWAGYAWPVATTFARLVLPDRGDPSIREEDVVA